MALAMSLDEKKNTTGRQRNTKSKNFNTKDSDTVVYLCSAGIVFANKNQQCV